MSCVMIFYFSGLQANYVVEVGDTSQVGVYILMITCKINIVCRNHLVKHVCVYLISIIARVRKCTLITRHSV